MYIVTGKTGTAHVTGADDGAFNQGLTGLNDYVLANKALSITQTDTGTLSIGKCEVVIQGRHGRIEGTETVSIDAEAAGYYRKDYVVVRYQNNSGIESMTVKVVKGTAASTEAAAVVPTLYRYDLYTQTGNTRDMALAIVNVYGPNITSINVVAKQLTCIDGLQSRMSAVEGVASSANTRSTTNQTNITSLQNNVSGIQKYLSQYVESALHTIGNDINEINSDVSSLQNLANTTKGAVETIGNQWKQLEGILNASGGSTTYAENTPNTIGYLNLTKGTWLVYYMVEYPATAANKYVDVYFTDGETGTSKICHSMFDSSAGVKIRQWAAVPCAITEVNGKKLWLHIGHKSVSGSYNVTGVNYTCNAVRIGV